MSHSIPREIPAELYYRVDKFTKTSQKALDHERNWKWDENSSKLWRKSMVNCRKFLSKENLTKIKKK